MRCFQLPGLLPLPRICETRFFMPLSFHARVIAALLLPLLISAQPPGVAAGARAGEALSYRIEWRLIHAGNARLTWNPAGPGGRAGRATLLLESAGLVSRLYKVNDQYFSSFDERSCVLDSLMKTDEGSRHREAAATFDQSRRKASYLEKDLNKKTVLTSREIDIPGCVYDVLGALYQLRAMRLEPGQSGQVPISDGKKVVYGKVEAQERETVKLDSGPRRTIRYEAFLFNNVLYGRKGRLFVWLTDDERRLPVQIRIRMPFYIGTVTLQLDKEEKS